MIGETRQAPAQAARSAGEIQVTISDAQEDVDDALAAVHDGFVEAGYMDPQPSGRRMHPSYLNPGTVFLTARIDGETVGAVAIIADGPFGLPADRAFVEELDELRATGAPVREVGSLAIRAQWRRHTRRIYMRLLAATVRMVFDRYPTSHMVLAVTPENERFNANLFGCETIAPSRPLYGAPAVLLRTDLERLKESYGGDGGPSRRAMGALVHEEHPPWLTEVVAERPWAPEWVAPLLAEQGLFARLEDQLARLARLCPQTAGGPAASLRVEVAA